MTYDQKELIANLQRSGKGYKAISSELNLPVNAVKSWCRRHPVQEQQPGSCRQCGAPLTKTPGKRERIFCSDRCRYSWWADHPNLRGRRVEYRHICRSCGKEFMNNRKCASYCDRTCFARARTKVHADG